MPRRRGPRAPTVEGSIEHVLCNEKDCMPRVMCFFPLSIGCVFGLVFTLGPITGSAWVKATFAALGFLAVAVALAYVAAGLPHFRRHGCATGCWVLLAAAAAGCCPAPPPRSGRAPEPELASAAPQEAAAVVEAQAPTSQGGTGGAGRGLAPAQ